MGAFVLLSWMALSSGALADASQAADRWEAVCAHAPVGSVQPSTRAALLRAAEGARARSVAVPTHLGSAGRAHLDDEVMRTRRAFADAEDARLLAMAWALSGHERYLESASERLDGWARSYVPSGHPIDETRLEALVVAYRIVAPALDEDVRSAVAELFFAMREAKERWTFSPRTSVNNHRTHQLKMLRLLDLALGDEVRVKQRVAAEQAHLQKNIDARTGETVDGVERDALYYHNYALEPWLEIAWLTGRVAPEVEAAVDHLARHIEQGDLGGEFTRSVSRLDAQRASAGFGYGAGGSTFEAVRARRVFWTWSALTGEPLNPALEEALSGPTKAHELYYQARGELCTRA